MAALRPLFLTAALAWCAGLANGAAAAAGVARLRSSSDVVYDSEADLHASMRDMMNDADDDDDFSDGSSGRFLQTNSGGKAEAAANAADLEASASSLSAALGPRWDAKTLEADAHEKTHALLQGIAGHQAVGSLTRLLGAMGR
uniref:Uncharacterized protein n=1 Tax=Strombidinopsis acuminata TaxID=141414 RepID=A0A7S3REF8_9SPIT|mmetsp:Transcript_16423/g.42421  ORF Transcript_16423/g.42421 Transcript_16423/m.42421 type:complete len:143 (-) Transcript_16423:63-491(-)